MSKQTLREGPMGKETTGEIIQTLSGSLSGKRSGSSPVYAYIIAHLSAIVKRFSKLFGKFFERDIAGKGQPANQSLSPLANIV